MSWFSKLRFRARPQAASYGPERAEHAGMLNKGDLTPGVVVEMRDGDRTVGRFTVLEEPRYYPGGPQADHGLVVDLLRMVTQEREAQSLSDFGMVPNAAGQWNQMIYLVAVSA